MPNLPQYRSSASDPNIMWRVDKAYKVAPTPKTSTTPVRADIIDSSDSSNSESEADSDDSGNPLVHKKHTGSWPAQHASPLFTNKTSKQTTVHSAQVSQAASDAGILNPPDIQRIIVEHVIKNDNAIASNHAFKRLRPFSGKLPKPPSEANFQTWSLHVELMIQDQTPTDVKS